MALVLILAISGAIADRRMVRDPQPDAHSRRLQSLACTYGNDLVCLGRAQPYCCETQEDDGTPCVTNAFFDELLCSGTTPYAACCVD
ncbi:g973 [Coccomyxa elongata]